MHVITDGDLHSWVSAQISADLKAAHTEAFGDEGFDLSSEATQYASQLIADVLSDNQKRYVELYAKHMGVLPYACLQAHGHADGNKWLHEDGNLFDNLVQDWVNKYDGKYAVLALLLCNPGAITVTAEKSLLLMPDDSFNSLAVVMGNVNFSLIHPSDEDFEYTIDYHLRQLEDRVKNVA